MPAKDKKLQQQNRVLAGLQETVADMISALDLQVILQKAVERTAELVGADIVTIHLYDPLRAEAHASAGYGLLDVETFRQYKPRRGKTVLLVAGKGEPVIAEDVSASDLAGPFTAREGVQSGAGFPLKAGDKVIGVLFVNYREPHKFEPEEVETVVSFGNLAAVAIENANLIKQERQRADAMDLLQQVSARISTPLDVEETLALIIEGAMRLTGTESGVIHLIDEAKQSVIQSYEVPEDFGHLPPRLSQKTGMTWTAVSTGQTIAVSDITKDERVNPAMAEEKGVRAIIGTPLKVEEETIGVLFLNDTEPHEFTEYEKELLSTLASQAAIAIQNARFFDSAQRRIRDLRIINEVVQVISRKLDTKDLLQTIVAQIAEKLNCTHCTLFFPQEEKGELWLVPEVTRGMRSKEIMTRRFKLDEKSLAGWVFLNRESLVLSDSKQDKRFAPARERREHPRSMLVAPVKVGDQIIGVISADQDEYGWFSESDRRLVDALAQQAGIAIQRATGLELLQDIGNQIISAPEVDDILQQVVSGAIKLTHTTAGVIYLVSGDGKSVTGRFLYPSDFDHPEPRMGREESITRQVIKTGKEIIIPDAHQDDRVNPLLYDRVQSMIAIALKLEQKVIGVLFLNDANRHDFTETEVSLLSTLASQAAIAIQNARLLQQERTLAHRQTSLLRHLQEVSRLALAGDYTDLADYAVKAAHDLTGAEVILWMMSEREGEHGQVLRIAAGRGESVDENYVLEAKMPITPGSSITVLALERGEPIVREDILEDLEKPEFYYIEEAKRRGWHSFMAIPLLGLGGVRLGSLNLRSQDIAAFGEFEIGLMRTLANQVSMAFENVQTVQKLDTQLESLHRVVQEESLGKVLEQILKGINTILGEGTSSSISLYDETSGSFGPSTAVGPLADLLRVPPRAKSGTGRHVIETREAYYLDDVTKPPSGCPTIRDALAEQNPIKSFAALPLKRQDRIVGVLFVNLQVPISFSAGVRRVLELFASQAAVAIENARLFRELEDRAERLVRLQEVTAAISAGPSDLVQLLHSIVGSLRDIFRGASCAIRLYDSRNEEFGPREAVGAVEELVDHPPRSEGTSRYVVRTQEPLYIEDVSATPPDGVPTLRREVLELGIKAAAYLPLRSEGEVIGILYMDLTEPRRFSQYDKQILGLFANQAVIAIENTRLLQDLDERAKQLEKLQKVTAEPSDLEKVLRVIVKSLSGIFREVPCAIRLYDSRTGAFERRVAIGDLDEQLIYIPRPNGATHYVVETKVPLYAEDISVKLPNGKPVIRKELAKQGLGAVAYLPLLSRESVVGMLYLNLPTPYQFSQNDKQILELFADQAAIAIENAQLYEAEQERRHVAETLRQASTVLSSTLELDIVLELILQQLRKVIPYNSASVQRLQGKRLEIVACQGFEEPDKVTGLVFPLDPKFPNYRVVTKKAPFAIEDVVQDYPHFKSEADRYETGHIRSWLGVPLMVKDQVIGIITLDRTEVRPYTAKESELARSFANQAAIAIENAWLFEQLDQRVQELEVLTEIGRTVSNLGIDQILDLVYEQTAKIMDLSNAQVQIAFYDEAKDEVSFPLAVEQDAGETIDVVRWSKREERYREAGEDEIVEQFKPRARRGPPGLDEYVIRTKEPLLIIEDFEQRAAERGIKVWPTFGRLDRPTHSWLGVPMMVADRVIGVISIRSLEQEHAFDEGQQELLATVASQAAIAIENARLYEYISQDLERRIQELEVLTEIGRTVSNLGIDQILDLVYEQAGKIMDLSNAQVQIASYDEAKDEVSFPLAVEQDAGETIDVVRWSKREERYREAGEDEIVEQFKPRARGTRYGLNEHVIRTKEPLLIVEDFEQKAADLGIEVWPTFGRLDRPTHSWLGVPMMVGGRVIGVISIQSLEQERAFDEGQQELLATVASQAAVAIENARLYKTMAQEVENRTRQLIEAQAVVTRTSIATDFVHRLNNLAGTIPIWVEQVREHLGAEALGDSMLADYLDNIESNTDGLLRAAEQLKSPPKEEDVDIESKLDSLVRQVRVQTPAEVEVHLHCPKELPTVRAIASDLSNALWSIIENGIEAMPDGGMLAIEAETTIDADDKEWIEIRVSDQGRGIAMGEADRVFLPFYSTKAEHMGYGLWRAKNVIDRIGGSIEFESKEGLGTTFIVRLPV
jgi:GAF domain-containing protein/anti-sigma regulatory factor (Ser/Thr protein kinase)